MPKFAIVREYQGEKQYTTEPITVWSYDPNEAWAFDTEEEATALMRSGKHFSATERGQRVEALPDPLPTLPKGYGHWGKAGYSPTGRVTPSQPPSIKPLLKRREAEVRSGTVSITPTAE